MSKNFLTRFKIILVNWFKSNNTFFFFFKKQDALLNAFSAALVILL